MREFIRLLTPPDFDLETLIYQILYWVIFLSMMAVIHWVLTIFVGEPVRKATTAALAKFEQPLK